MKKYFIQSIAFAALFAGMVLSGSDANAQRTPVTKSPATKSPAKVTTPSRPSSSSSSSSKRPSSSSSTRPSSSSSSSSASRRPSSSSSSSSSSRRPSSSSSSSSSRPSSSTSSRPSSSTKTSTSSSRPTKTYTSTKTPSRKEMRPMTAKDSKPVSKAVPLSKTTHKEIYTPTRTPGIEQIQTFSASKNDDGKTKNATAAVITMASGTENVPLMVDDAGEPLTVYESVMQMPQQDRDSISNVAQEQIQLAKRENRPNDVIFWGRVNNTVTRPDQNACLGKSYGDPHMRTYDGYTYDLQSVGEYVLTKSAMGTFEIQTRQSARSGGRISLNTAAAMNVNGDRVCIYSQGHPDKYTTTPVRINGNPLTLSVGESFTLLRGGIVRREASGSYRISWPTGEQTLIKFFSGGKYMNVLPQVFAAGNHGGYVGLLGNADGIPSNDLVSKFGSQTTIVRNFYNMSAINNNQSISNQARRSEVKYNKSIINDFAASWRVNSINSLFDYPIGENTYDYRKGTNAKKVATLATVPQENIDNARKACEEAGITDEDMLKGCILDVSTSNDAELAKAIADVENDDDLVKDLKIENKLQPIQTDK